MKGKNVILETAVSRIIDIYPLSPMQSGMLFHNLFSSGTSAYLTQSLLKLNGSIDPEILKEACKGISNLHSVLRTGFVWEKLKDPLQYVLESVEVCFKEFDWRGSRKQELEQRLESFLLEDRKKGFDLTAAPLFRISLIHYAADHFYLVWSHHHILLDGWSFSIVLRDLFKAYQEIKQKRTVFFKNSRPYRDYIAWVQRQEVKRAEIFWKDYLADYPYQVEVNNYLIIKELNNGNKGEDESSDSFVFTDEETEAIKNFAALHHLTLNTVIQGVVGAALKMCTKQQEVVLGITVSGRTIDLSGIEDMVGLFINTLPLRITHKPEETDISFLRTLQGQCQMLNDFAYVSLAQIQSWSSADKRLFDVILIFEPNFVGAEEVPADLGFTVESLGGIGNIEYSLSIFFRSGTQLMFSFCYKNRSRFNKAFIKDLSDCIREMLKNLAENFSSPHRSEHTIFPSILFLNKTEERRSLSVIDKDLNPETAGDYIAPKTPVEQQLVSIWTEVLKIEKIGINHHFFKIGGHSLIAMQVVSRVRQQYGIDLPLRMLFEHPTIAGLSAFVESLSRKKNRLQIPSITAKPRPLLIPLSFAQRRLWFLDQLLPNTVIYNIPVVFHLKGSVNRTVLEKAFNALIQRHESLRTCFPVNDGEAQQLILSDFAIQLEKRKSLSDIENLAGQEAFIPFDLSAGPLMRANLIALPKEEHALLVTFHHIIADGWSLKIFFQELSTLYNSYINLETAVQDNKVIQDFESESFPMVADHSQKVKAAHIGSGYRSKDCDNLLSSTAVSRIKGKEPSLPSLEVQYADFAIWQRDWLQGKILETQLNYWKQQLAGIPDLLKLPTDKPRPKELSYHGGSFELILFKETVDQLKSLAREQNASLFMMLLAIFQILLHRYTGQNDIVVGSPIANRHYRETENLIGLFVNTLALRIRFKNRMTFIDLLDQVKETTLQAYQHQDVPFEQLVDYLNMTRELNRNPIFQVMFTFQNSEEDVFLSLGDELIKPLELTYPVAKFDLSLHAFEDKGCIKISINYATDLFEINTIKRLADRFKESLDAMIADPRQSIEICSRLYCAPTQIGDLDCVKAPGFDDRKGGGFHASPNLQFVSARSIADNPLPKVIHVKKQSYSSPRNQLEEQLCQVFAEVLNLPESEIGISCDFFEMGGDSISSVKLITLLRKKIGLDVNVKDIFVCKSIEKLSEKISRQKVEKNIGNGSVNHADFVPYVIVNENINRENRLFLFPPGYGGAECYLNNMAQNLIKNPLVLFNNLYLFHKNKPDANQAASVTFQNLATDYIDYIKSIQPNGPYHFFGWSFGGILAFEIARQLTEKGNQVDKIVLLDPFFNYKKAVGKTNAHLDTVDEINYKYFPMVNKIKFHTKITLFKSSKIVDSKTSKENPSRYKIYKYYAENTQCNHLDDLLECKNFKVKIMDHTHDSWIKDELQVKEICKELEG